MTKWIDFKELRQKLTFEQVLGFYRVPIKRKANGQHQDFCPLPLHDGKRRVPSFSANLERGIFQCFGCGARGNLLDFAVLMERVPLTDSAGFRRVALKLQERLCAKSATKVSPKLPASSSQTLKREPQVLVNEPLDFELKGLDYAHPYLLRRGFTAKTIAYFGLGVAARGSFEDRLAIPLHVRNGLVGYAGRVINDAAITAENPRYLFPSNRERNGVCHEFRKDLFLYNGQRITQPVKELAVVEGFTGVWWLHQHGYAETVATMGNDCSEEQARLIVSSVEPNGRVWVLSDGDAAGRQHAQSVLLQVSPHRFVRWAKLSENKQPTDLSALELASLLS